MEAMKREAKRHILSMLHQMQAKVEQRRVNAELKNYTTDVITNIRPERKRSVLFVVTRMVRFHGGQTSILRLGTQLARLGFQVGYAVYKPQSKQEMELCAKSNLADFEGMLFTAPELSEMIAGRKKTADIVVASSWDTVSFVKKLPGYKMYFVQDYEPYFYSFGELFLLAKKTYEQGLHMVSLGAWNKAMIERECKPVSPVDVIDFPYEKKEYQTVKKDFAAYAKKKKFVLAVYLKFYGKRLPCVIPYLLKEAKQELAADGITLEVRYFGEAGSFQAPGGKNLGMLTKEELCALYYEADFGMVASMSNISLVPYEMLSAGLPVIEFRDGTFSDFFPEGSATLIGLSGKELAAAIRSYRERPEQLTEQLAQAESVMKDLSWERSGKQFAEIIERLV
ncbi:MAG: glycosyltransferase family 4 protein [Lachnospiraceae bacterium]|nr:glycosyltransferase family 4 protein [Lachnospiraceae bacterium]